MQTIIYNTLLALLHSKITSGFMIYDLSFYDFCHMGVFSCQATIICSSYVTFLIVHYKINVCVYYLVMYYCEYYFNIVVLFLLKSVLN